jgi:anti-sigma factor RsiW
MSNHERFEELCVLAAAGELGSAEQQELKAHLETCAACSRTFADMKEIHAAWLPERPDFEIKRSFAAESQLRQSILRKAAAQGAEFSAEAELPTFTSTPVASAQVFSRRVPRPMLAIAAGLLVMFLGFGMFRLLRSQRTVSQQPVVAQVSIPVQTNVLAATESPELDRLREDLRASQSMQAKLEASLAEMKSGREDLQRRLTDAEARARSLEQSNAGTVQEASTLRSQLEAANANEAKGQEQLAAFKKSQSDRQMELAVLENENRDLREKLALQTASVGHEQELMADGREIRDLIAARNLHIIDVYDTSGKGQTQKSFGRVFYTEGKSLVFYAYDLPARRPETKYAFYAWGKRDVSGDVKVRNLGIFYNDDQAQRRWVLKINDPALLSEIDSVFVTLEKTDDSTKSPNGKKLLSAYLGTPANHP